MKKLLWCIICIYMLSLGCALSRKLATSNYSENWERATLASDEFGSKLMVIRLNNEKWVIEAKTYCFWTATYVGREVWFQWGPVECKVKNDNGEICEFWTKEQMR